MIKSFVLQIIYRYEEKIHEKTLVKEDLSDMVAEHAARQKVEYIFNKTLLVIVLLTQNKRKKASESSSSKSTKKLKEFKF